MDLFYIYKFMVDGNYRILDNVDVIFEFRYIVFDRGRDGWIND